MSNYSITLWDSLKYEILNVQEEDLAEEALAALRAIAVSLSHGLGPADSKTSLTRYLNPITKECNEQLRQPQHKQAKPAGQILSSLGAASPSVFYLIVKAVVAPLLTLYQDADSIAKQRALLEVLMQILACAITLYGTSGSTNAFPQIDNPLEPFKDRLFENFSQALMSTANDEVSFRIVALNCLLRLCSLRKYLQDNEVGMAVQYFDEIILLESSDGRDDLKDEAIQALVEISRIKATLIMDITFPAFMAKLPDATSEKDKDYIKILEALARLSVEKATSDTLIRRLLNRLDVVLQNGGSASYPQAILSTLHYILSRRELAKDPNLNSYHERIVVGLITRATLSSSGESPDTALNEDASLEILGRVSNLIVRALDIHKQHSVAGQIYSLFSDENKFTPIPFRKDAPDSQRFTMILSTYLLAGVWREVSLIRNSKPIITDLM